MRDLVRRVVIGRNLHRARRIRFKPNQSGHRCGGEADREQPQSESQDRPDCRHTAQVKDDGGRLMTAALSAISKAESQVADARQKTLESWRFPSVGFQPLFDGLPVGLGKAAPERL